MRSELLLSMLVLAALAAIWLVARSSKASRSVTQWLGPFPGEVELRSSYYRRKSLFALKCLLLVLALFAAIWVLAQAFPALASSRTLGLLYGLSLFFFAGMATVGTLFAAFTSLKAALFGPNPIVRVQWERARLEGESGETEA